MHRFFVPFESISETKVVFPAEISFQIRKVLRLNDGEKVAVLDNSGLTRLVTLELTGNGSVEGVVQETIRENRELPIHLDLYVSLTSREKFEWVLQKTTEAGVSRIIPFISERSLIHGNEKDPDMKKQQRRVAIMREAAEQCERSLLPTLEPAVSFQDAIRSVSVTGTNLLFWEEEKKRTIWQALDAADRNPSRISLMTGPEGGFTEMEAQFAQSHGWQLVTLGSRILRMETAAIAAILQTAYEIDRRKSLP
jgi:16S rRNA (uracil1498-N3)-methyltransferase